MSILICQILHIPSVFQLQLQAHLPFRTLHSQYFVELVILHHEVNQALYLVSLSDLSYPFDERYVYFCLILNSAYTFLALEL